MTSVRHRQACIIPNHEVDLKWTPHKGFVSGSCPKSCSRAYQEIAQSHCKPTEDMIFSPHNTMIEIYQQVGGHAGGESNAMAKNGTWDTGCGQYSWSITQTDHSSSTISYEPSRPIRTENSSSRIATETVMWYSSLPA
ncbi:hypothetical protein CDEST_01925 [Colletotrichum destructivum]|uniref:Uncharacterized protein n=1 Tax=Colletotrichum destructivum TaxID=34406 RepID=A0AAX4I0G4_9PEZI|nr:hypothetical protein CDEST_01925 [Colletotrichum destructivum]